MSDYILRNIDPATWDKFKSRAQKDGHSLRWVIVELIKRYIRDGLS